MKVRLLLRSQQFQNAEGTSISEYQTDSEEVRIMANKTLFKSLIGKLVPATDAVNEERAPAYALSPKHQLAQYAATGCLNTTFYATADGHLA
ncbi:MAG TPA: hypothetical protein VJ875_24620 [Pyrinomonadaceae bacterium]|nr:hypothetical protein [Pyrinomonadaceae bacterium]